MTTASEQALNGLRDFSTLQWYVIPLLALIFFIYTKEMKKAKASGNWDAILAGVTLFSADFINETVNGWILMLSGRSALWTAPGPTALRTMVGWNVEIMFMFLILGIIYYNTIDRKEVKIAGIPNRWFWAILYSLFCVFIECYLNKADMLVWEYSFWNRTFGGIWLIILFGYFWFFVITKFMLERKTLRQKIMVPVILLSIAIIMNAVGFGLLGFNY
ncbi:MAG: hypothetical protein PF637_00935 [Spirochaetes bacterium]|jgi:hypothetical protein|nr:hypothetical protein [Spirochaetota bacterium]